MRNIPIFIICHNNYIYVENTIRQIIDINSEYDKCIHIFDNSSTDKDTLRFLRECGRPVQYCHANICPKYIIDHIIASEDEPEPFCITDPDLEFNPNLPSNFITVLFQLSKRYRAGKCGFALRIDDHDDMFPETYFHGKSIPEWENQFWGHRLHHPNYELYLATIDTTFCLINPEFHTYFNKITQCIRVAGKFTARHLPWYRENPILIPYEQFQMYSEDSDMSSTARLILLHLQTRFISLSKKEETILVPRDSSHISFWENEFAEWRPDIFNMLDQYLTEDSVFIDIGGWIGVVAIYASRKCSRVFTVESDPETARVLTLNCSYNVRNVSVIERFVYDVDDMSIHVENSGRPYTTTTTTLYGLIRSGVDFNRVSLIRCGIDGNEESILSDLHSIGSRYGASVYVSFNYLHWKDTNLDRFDFLTDDMKQRIRTDPRVSLFLVS